MRTVKLATLVIAASASLFACKPKEEAKAPVAEVTEEAAAPEESATAAAVDRREACNITMTAPESNDWTTYWEPSGAGGNGAKSIHWANATEKEARAANLLSIPLEITCTSSESPNISITLSASQSTEEDVPMAPGSYPIWGREQSPLQGKQFLAASLSFNGRTFDSRNGTITVSEFSSEGVKGSFILDGAEMQTEAAEPIHIEGTFDFPCRGGLLESACTATHD